MSAYRGMLAVAFALGACTPMPEPEPVTPEGARTAGGQTSASPVEGARAPTSARVGEPEPWDEASRQLQESDLRDRVEQALRGAPQVDEAGIDVRVDGSHVMLAGVVATPTAILIARDVVQAVPGVERVTVDALRVRRR